MDRYLLEQIGGAKQVMFRQSQTLTIGPHHRSNYAVSQLAAAQVDVHFAARFYT